MSHSSLADDAEIASALVFMPGAQKLTRLTLVHVVFR